MLSFIFSHRKIETFRYVGLRKIFVISVRFATSSGLAASKNAHRFSDILKTSCEVVKVSWLQLPSICHGGGSGQWVTLGSGLLVTGEPCMHAPCGRVARCTRLAFCMLDGEKETHRTVHNSQGRDAASKGERGTHGATLTSMCQCAPG